MVPPEGLQTGPFAHVPNPNGLVLGGAENHFLTWVEGHTRDVAIVSAAGVNLPTLRFVHSPHFNQTVIGSCHH